MKLNNVIAIRNNKTIYLEDDLSIKVFNEKCTKSDVFNEALNQTRIEETGLNIPKIVEVTMTDGNWAVASEYIKGKTLAQLIQENPEKKTEYLEQLVALQSEIHSKSCPQIGILREKLTRRILASDLDATARYDLYTRLESLPRNAKICHGDFDPSNVVITEDGTPFILDWSQVTQGNPVADIAQTYVLFLLKNDEAGAKEYLNIFCLKNDISREDVYKWVPIVAASQSVESEGEERERLLSLVSSEDYR